MDPKRSIFDYGVACKVCRAAAGEMCVGKDGKPMPVGLGHIARAVEVDMETGKPIRPEVRSD
jgi:hypothetical protein